MAFNWDFSFYGGGGALPSMPTGGGDWNYSNIDQLINSIYNPTPTPDTSWESGWDTPTPTPDTSWESGWDTPTPTPDTSWESGRDTPTPEGTVDMEWNVPDTNWD